MEYSYNLVRLSILVPLFIDFRINRYTSAILGLCFASVTGIIMTFCIVRLYLFYFFREYAVTPCFSYYLAYLSANSNSNKGLRLHVVAVRVTKHDVFNVQYFKSNIAFNRCSLVTVGI